MTVNARRCVLIPLSALVICGSSALAQNPQADAERLRREGVERTDAAARAQGMEQTRQLQERERQAEESRRSQSSSSTGGGYTPSPSGGNSAGAGSDYRALGKEMLRLPPLPVERNVLLGSWRLEGGGQQSKVLEFGLTGKGATPGMGELMGFMESMESGQLACDISFGRGITFTPTTFSSGGAAGIAGGPIAYRSRNKQVIAAIPGDSRANPMFFEIAGPNRIVWGGTCALVRVGAAHAAANTAAAPGHARAGAASPAAPPAAGEMPQVAAVAPRPLPSRPPPEVCRNFLIDRLGRIGRAEAWPALQARFRQVSAGTVPGTQQLRLDARASACDDPRANAVLYDFDGAGVLQSITIVWARPAGPAPAPIFSERAQTLARLYGLPAPASPSRLEGVSPTVRVVLHDLPERSLLVEAYAAPR
jgi:hypothetical protein